MTATSITKKLRVLCVHNSYQHAGGEDSVFRNEADMLQTDGHVVERFCVSNDHIHGAVSRTTAAITATYSPAGRRIMRTKIDDFQPDVVHVHNFFPRLSPAVFDACQDAGVPSVWTLHNFRVACANGLLFREGVVCEDCVGKLPTSAIRHRCYRQSYVGSAAVAAMIAYHASRKTWLKKVNRFIALNDFARDVFIRSGLPADRIVVKPNASPPAPDRNKSIGRSGALYVGRLSKEKGVRTLVEAWASVETPLTIVGDGPDRTLLEKMATKNVTFSGFLSPDSVASAMIEAEVVIIPSIWYENFPMSLVEAMAAGTPVIVSRLGALSRIVEEGINGLHFKVGDAVDLARVVNSALATPGLLESLGKRAKDYWATHMSPKSNLSQLVAIYESAIADAPAL